MRKRSGQVHSRESSATLQLTVSLLYLCSMFNLTEECTFDIIQAERTNVPEQIFLCEVCYESTEECIPYDGQRVKII